MLHVSNLRLLTITIVKGSTGVEFMAYGLL